MSLMDMWLQCQRLRSAINQAGLPEVPDEAWEPLDEMEERLLRAPITNREDAAAVLLAAGLSTATGARADGLDCSAYQREASFFAHAHAGEVAA